MLPQLPMELLVHIAHMMPDAAALRTFALIDRRCSFAAAEKRVQDDSKKRFARKRRVEFVTEVEGFESEPQFESEFTVLPDGTPHGDAVIHDRDTGRVKRGTYVDGHREGVWVTQHWNDVTFTKFYVRGKKNGQCALYDEDDHIIWEANYVDDYIQPGSVRRFS